MARNRPLHLVLDYDGTLTTKDTMSTFRHLSPLSFQTWPHLVEAYSTDYKHYKSLPFPWKLFDRSEFSLWLSSRKWVEDQSSRRALEAGIFQDVRLIDVEKAVEKSFSDREIEMRTGWREVFHAISSDEEGGNDRVSILSVNWSASMIRSSLKRAARGAGDEKVLRAVERMRIWANEIESLRGEGVRAGEREGIEIRTNEDKLRVLRGRAASGGSFVVYVGDSSTDFDCLCEADLGIWLCDVSESEYQEAFKATFAPLRGFVPRPLAAVADLSDCHDLFYWAPSFEPLLRLLLPTQEQKTGTTVQNVS